MGSFILAICFGIGILYVFYRAVRSEWPDSYMTLDTSGLEYAMGLLHGWFTFFVPGVPVPERCHHAEEVPTRVQAWRGVLYNAGDEGFRGTGGVCVHAGKRVHMCRR